MSLESKVIAFKNLYGEISRRKSLVEGKVFKAEYVYADFNRYDKCEFIGCTLIFEFGICSFAHCRFSKCKFEAKTGSPAALILQLDRELRESAFRESHR